MPLAHVCSVHDLEPASALTVDLVNMNGDVVSVAVVRDSDGSWHAIGDTCSHDDYSLSEGDIEEGEIECWKHGALFSLATGKALTLPATKPVPVFVIEISGDDVLVDVDSTM